MKIKLILQLTLLFLYAFFNFSKAAIFIVAHPDDIELLMGGNAINDVQSNYPTTFILTTAGDAGAGITAGTSQSVGQNTQGNPYYRVRLSAHEEAVQNWIESAGRTAIKTRSTEYFSDSIPAVEKVTIGNVTMYYLNLPDGKIGDLRVGNPPALKDITGNNQYTNDTLKSTVREIIRRNYMNVPTIVINLPEYEYEYQYVNGQVISPDHGDHIATGLMTMEAITEVGAFNCLHKAIYTGYPIASTSDSLTKSQKNSQIGSFYDLNSYLVANGNPNTWDTFHINFFGKQVFRIGAPGSTCAF